MCLRLETQADDDRSWNTKLSVYLCLGTWTWVTRLPTSYPGIPSCVRIWAVAGIAYDGEIAEVDEIVAVVEVARRGSGLLRARVYLETRDQGPGPGTWDQGPGTRTRDQGPRTRDPGPGTRDQGPRARDQGPRPGTKDQGPGTRGQGPGPRDQGPGTRGQGPGTRDP